MRNGRIVKKTKPRSGKEGPSPQPMKRKKENAPNQKNYLVWFVYLILSLHISCLVCISYIIFVYILPGLYISLHIYLAWFVYLILSLYLSCLVCIHLCICLAWFAYILSYLAWFVGMFRPPAGPHIAPAEI